MNQQRAEILSRRSLRAYANNQLSTAIAWAQQACAEAPDWGPAWWALALSQERSDNDEDAARSFAHAANAVHEPCDLPIRIAWQDFCDCITAAQNDLPPALLAASRACHLILDDYTPAAFLNATEDEDSYELLGLFSGHPLPDHSYEGHGDTAATIYMWRRPHEHCCEDYQQCLAEIRNTYYHELGHYFGYDEDGIAAMGLS
ncbi:MAG: metallopeptidase family protein [Planctomycetota bacterium]|nr:MAG: metallopeptidase family protein [Planctomycetota bacterium]